MMLRRIAAIVAIWVGLVINIDAGVGAGRTLCGAAFS